MMEPNLPNKLLILALAGFMDLTSEGKCAISALLPLLSPVSKIRMMFIYVSFQIYEKKNENTLCTSKNAKGLLI